MAEVVVLATEGIGDRSYLVHDGRRGVVIDPQNDIDRVRTAATDAAVEITHVFETHVHNDYVSGGLELARACQASYVVAADEPVSFWRERLGVHDGDRLRTGELEIEVVHTPGHTPHHLSYVVRAGGATEHVFTGGSLLIGSVGRTDLFGADSAQHLARAQWRSVRRLAATLPGATSVFPTHGFGSFCAAGSTDARTEATLSEELEHNRALLVDEDEFVATAVRAIGPFPRYYGHMSPLNRLGRPGPPGTMRPTSVAELAEQACGGGLVVDVRPRRDFASGHLPQSINVEWSPTFPAYLGWAVPWGIPLGLLAGDDASLRAAAAALAHIGVADLSGAVLTPPLPRSSSYPVTDFAGLGEAAARGDRVTVVDVRERSEWDESHLTGALHAPFHSIEAAVPLLPRGPLFVHCARGQRASIAASLLARLGQDPVLVDDCFENAAAAGLSLSRD